MIRKVTIFFVCISLLCGSFSFVALASEDDDSVTFDGPSFPINKTDIRDFDHIGSGTVTLYTGSSSWGQGIKIAGQVGSSDSFLATINNVYAGKTYIVTGDLATGAASSRCFLEFSVASGLDTALSFDASNPNYWKIDDSTRSTPQKFSYSFKPEFSNINLNSNQEPYIYFLINVVLRQSEAYIRLNNLSVICLDDIVVSSLRSINSELDGQTDLIQRLVNMINENFYGSALQGSPGNIPAILHNIKVFGQWFLDRTKSMNDSYSNFYDEYGEDFAIAIYEALVEGLGLNDEYEADTQLGSDVSDYIAAESNFMQDRSGDVSQALGSGMSAISSNNSFAFIRNCIQWFGFDNAKISAYIIFALGMGLVVLIIGRKVNS